MADRLQKGGFGGFRFASHEVEDTEVAQPRGEGRIELYRLFQCPDLRLDIPELAAGVRKPVVGVGIPPVPEGALERSRRLTELSFLHEGVAQGEIPLVPGYRPQVDCQPLFQRGDRFLASAEPEVQGPEVESRLRVVIRYGDRSGESVFRFAMAVLGGVRGSQAVQQVGVVGVLRKTFYVGLFRA